MSYTGLSVLMGAIMLGLCLGYRNNMVNDESKKQRLAIQKKENKERLEKLASLYPSKDFLNDEFNSF